jgi:hypothetical protein
MKATYESLVGNLKGELDSGKLQVQQLRDGISVNLAQDILFKSGPPISTRPAASCCSR